MTERFVGKVADVLGGDSGSELASAKVFSNEGAQVIIAGCDSETLRIAAREIGHGAGAHRRGELHNLGVGRSRGP